MSEDKAEVNPELVKQIFELANIPKNSKLSDENLLNAITKIKSVLNADANEPYTPTSNNILVVDDIGVVTYQLKVLFKKLGYNVQAAKDIFNGLDIFTKAHFAFIIMDLFVSTEQEGYTLLHEAKKIITKNNLDTKIVVITASTKAEDKVKCLNGGADYFLKKEAGWQDKLIEIVENKKPEE